MRIKMAGSGGGLVTVGHSRSILPRLVTAGRIGKTKANFRLLGETNRNIQEENSLHRSKRVIKPPFRFACMRATLPSMSKSSKSTTSSFSESSATLKICRIQKKLNPRTKSKRVIKPPFRFACMRATSPSVFVTSSNTEISSSGANSSPTTLSVSVSAESQVRRRRETVWKQSDFVNLIEIGSGAFGKVYRAFAKPLNDLVALKFIELKDALGMRSKCQTDIGFEYRLQRSISHPNLCRVLGEFSDMTNRVLVLEFCAGDLHDYIYKTARANPNRLPNLKKCKRLVKDLVSAVVYLHGKAGYIHMDLKPENILLTLDGILKVTDFGSAIKMINYRYEHTYGSHRGGTIAYRPPEMLRKTSFDSTADVWAIGCIAYELLMRDHPFFPYATRQKELPEQEMIRRGLEEIRKMRDGSFQEKFTKSLLPTQVASFFRQIFDPLANRPLIRDLEGLRWLNSYHEHYSSPFTQSRSGTG